MEDFNLKKWLERNKNLRRGLKSGEMWSMKSTLGDGNSGIAEAATHTSSSQAKGGQSEAWARTRKERQGPERSSYVWRAGTLGEELPTVYLWTRSCHTFTNWEPWKAGKQAQREQPGWQSWKVWRCQGKRIVEESDGGSQLRAVKEKSW